MPTALDTFEINFFRVKTLHSLCIALSKQVTAIVDLTDLLRAEVVMAVSALDHFIHEFVRIGMIESWEGIRPKTDAFNRFQLPVSVAGQLNSSPTSSQFFESEIRTKHSFLSFQHPDKIADALRLVSNVKLWDEVGALLGASAKDVKASLALIVDRRNKIAHEADIDPSYPGQRWPIDAPLVENILKEIEDIVRAIFTVAN